MMIIIDMDQHELGMLGSLLSYGIFLENEKICVEGDVGEIREEMMVDEMNNMIIHDINRR